MGTVYRARDLTDGATVAVKILNGREVREVARFEQEASMLAGLDPPGDRALRRPRHRRRASASSPWSGSTARTWRRGSSAAGSTSPRRSRWRGASAEALAVAHARGIVHRDIKPRTCSCPAATIERLKVLDFGIARLTRGARKLTATGSRDRHARLHGARAGARRARHRRARRRVRARLRAVRVPDRARRFEADDVTALLAKILLEEAPRRGELVPEPAAGARRRWSRACSPRTRAAARRRRAVIAELDALGTLADAGGRGAPSARRRAPAAR